MTTTEIVLVTITMLSLVGCIYTNEIIALFSKTKVVELIKIDNDNKNHNFYHGKLDDDRLVQVRCRYGYVEVVVSQSNKNKSVGKCIFSKYFDDRKNTCKMGFDDALYFLKKAGFNVENTNLLYKDMSKW